MRNEQRGNNWKRVILVIFFMALLIIIGVLLERKLESLLTVHMEEYVAAQAGTFAEAMDRNFDMKLSELEGIADNLRENEANMQEILELLAGDAHDGYTMGILALGGEAVYGQVLDYQQFPGIQEAFRGNPAVCYGEGKGLLFTVPVYSGSNVKYVLYRLYEDAVLVEEFGLSAYRGEGEVFVVDKAGIVISSVNGNSELEESFFQGKREQAFAIITEKMNIATTAAVYDGYAGEEDFLFVSEIGDTEIGDNEMYLIGVVSKNTFSEGISEIKNLVLWVFGLLALLFVIGLTYIFSVEEKIRESNKLRQEKEMAEHANQIKGEFLARMSHEIRTPINTVVGMNEMILRECGDEEIRNYANNINTASRNLLALVNDILDFSKIEAGQTQINEKEYELGDVLKNAYNMIQFRAKQKNLQFDIQVEETLPYKLYGDANRIQQILLNLLSNAVKYTRTGGFVLGVTGEILDESNILLEIYVKDTGIGIRKEDMDRLFQDFERLDMDRNRNIEGTGLGLAISYRLAEQMNGKLSVSSEYGKGSTFTLQLPQRIVEAESIVHYKERYYDGQDLKEKKDRHIIAPDAHVLAVDDNEMNLMVIKNLLKHIQVQVTCCMGGAECLEAVQQAHYDVILLDHMMPGMDGMETLKHLRAMQEREGYHTPVIALTANAIDGVREKYLKAGFDDYLSKPVDANKLEDLLLKYTPKEKCVQVSVRETKTECKEIPDAEKKSHAEENSGSYLSPETGRQYCGGEEAVYREVLKMFCDAKEEKKQKLQEYFAEADWKNYTISIHALKSTSLTIGGKVLSKQAAELEKAGKQGETERIQGMHQEMMELYDKTVREAEEYLVL